MGPALILVADDNPDTRTIVRLALEHRGYRVMTAVDGQDAVDQARDRQPDLILMDLQMPRLSGFDAVRILKADESTADIPVLAVTAISSAGDVRAYGFCGILFKPILPTELAKAVEHCRKETRAGREWVEFASTP